MSTASSSVARSSTAATSGQGLSGGGEGESTSSAGSPFSLVDSGGVGVSHGTRFGGASTPMRDDTEGSNTSAFVAGSKGLFGAVGASLAGRAGSTPLATLLGSTRKHTSPLARDGPSPLANLQNIMEQSDMRGVDSAGVELDPSFAGLGSSSPDIAQFRKAIKNYADGEPTHKLYFYEDKTVPEICGGKVGTNRVCVMKAGECGFLHGNKMFRGLKAGFYLLDSKDGTRMFMDPYLPQEVAGRTRVLAGFVDSELPRSTWNVVFAYCGRVAEAGDERPEEVEEMNAFVEQSRDPEFQTPRHKRIRFTEGTATELDGVSFATLREVEKEFTRLDHAVRSLRGQVGVASEDSASMSLWSGLQMGEESVKSSKAAISELLSDVATHKLTLDRTVTESASAMTVGRQAMLAVEQLKQTGGLTDAVTVRNDITSLRQRVEAAEQHSTAFSTFVVDLFGGKYHHQLGIGSASHGAGQAAGGVAQADFDLHVAASDLTMSQFRQELKGGGVVVAGYELAGLDDCRTFCVKHFPVKTYQCMTGLMYALQLVTDLVVRQEDVQRDEIHQARTGRNSMQTTMVASFNTTYPPAFEGPKESAAKDTKYDFNAMQTYHMWNPQDGSNKGTFKRLNEQLQKQFTRLRSVIDLTLAKHPTAKSVAYDMLSEVKAFWTTMFKTELTDFYMELLGYAYGEGPYPKDIQESCWTLVMKMLRLFFEELSSVRIVACEAHLLVDELDINGMFMYATLEEIRVMREFSSHNFRKHPKFYPEVVMFLFETYVPKSLFDKDKKKGGGKGDHNTSLTIKMSELQSALDESDRVAARLRKEFDSLASTVSNVGKQCGYVPPPRKKGSRNNDD